MDNLFVWFWFMPFLQLLFSLNRFLSLDFMSFLVVVSSSRTTANTAVMMLDKAMVPTSFHSHVLTPPSSLFPFI